MKFPTEQPPNTVETSETITWATQVHHSTSEGALTFATDPGGPRTQRSDTSVSPAELSDLTSSHVQVSSAATVTVDPFNEWSTLTGNQAVSQSLAEVTGSTEGSSVRDLLLDVTGDDGVKTGVAATQSEDVTVPSESNTSLVNYHIEANLTATVNSVDTTQDLQNITKSSSNLTSEAPHMTSSQESLELTSQVSTPVPLEINTLPLNSSVTSTVPSVITAQDTSNVHTSSPVNFTSGISSNSEVHTQVFEVIPVVNVSVTSEVSSRVFPEVSSTSEVHKQTFSTVNLENNNKSFTLGMPSSVSSVVTSSPSPKVLYHVPTETSVKSISKDSEMPFQATTQLTSETSSDVLTGLRTGTNTESNWQTTIETLSSSYKKLPENETHTSPSSTSGTYMPPTARQTSTSMLVMDPFVTTGSVSAAPTVTPIPSAASPVGSTIGNKPLVVSPTAEATSTTLMNKAAPEVTRTSPPTTATATPIATEMTITVLTTPSPASLTTTMSAGADTIAPAATITTTTTTTRTATSMTTSTYPTTPAADHSTAPPVTTKAAVSAVINHLSCCKSNRSVAYLPATGGQSTCCGFN